MVELLLRWIPDLAISLMLIIFLYLSLENANWLQRRPLLISNKCSVRGYVSELYTNQTHSNTTVYVHSKSHPKSVLIPQHVENRHAKYLHSCFFRISKTDEISFFLNRSRFPNALAGIFFFKYVIF